MATSSNARHGSTASLTKLNLAEAGNFEAEAALHTAEMRKTIAEAIEAEAKAAKATIELERERHKRIKELAADEFHHTYLFDKEVAEASVKACIKQLAEWERCNEQPLTIELVINSPGGEVFNGFALIDYIISMQAREHTVNTIAYGMAASMAGVILQVGNSRAMGANALMLLHEGSLGAMGDFGKVEDRVALMKLMHERILSLFVSRSSVSRRFITSKWHRTDWWLTADECLKHGFVDEVR